MLFENPHEKPEAPNFARSLSTIYMGLKLKNPIIAGASALTANMDSIKRLEDAGVAALVTKSLFEEKIQLERFKFDEDLEKGNYRNAEAWMDKNRYGSLAEFRGKLSKRHSSDPWAYTRAQYARLLMNPYEIVKDYPAI